MPKSKEYMKEFEDLGKRIAESGKELRKGQLEEGRKLIEERIQPEKALRKAKRELRETRLALFRANFSIEGFDIAVWLVAIFFFTTIYWLPQLLNIGIIIAIALLSTLIIRDNRVQAIAITFSVIYLLLSLFTGIVFSSLDIFVLIFGFNTITLFPILISSWIFISLVGLGIMYGTKDIFWWTPYVVIVLAVFLSFLDALVVLTLLSPTIVTFGEAYFTFFTNFILHLSIYIIAFFLTYIITAGGTLTFRYLLQKTTELPIERLPLHPIS